MRLGYHTITWGGVVGDAVGVTSVKDLYYRANGPMDRAITEIGDEDIACPVERWLGPRLHERSVAQS